MQTPNQVLELFRADGTSVAEWARTHGFAVALVYRVLRGEAQCLRGQSHKIGLALGIKTAASTAQSAQIEQIKNYNSSEGADTRHLQGAGNN